MGYLIGDELTLAKAVPEVDVPFSVLTRASSGLIKSVGVDSSAKKNSKNLITSGAAYSIIEQIKTSVSSVPTPNWQQVTAAGASTTLPITLKNTDASKSVIISLDINGHVLFNAGVNQNFHFSGDVVALSGLTPPASSWYDNIPIATSSVLGVVKIGSGLSIDGAGLLTASGGGGGAWGSITGTLSAQTDLNTAFNGKANTLSGTLNYIPKFTSTSTIGNSAIVDTGTAIEVNYGSTGIILKQASSVNYTGLRIYNDINTAVRALEIDYVGSAYAGGERSLIYNTGAYPMVFGINNVEKMRLDSSGNLGIGTTNPLYRLDVHQTDTVYNTRFHQPNAATTSYNANLMTGAMTSVVGYMGIGGSATGNVMFRDAFVTGTQTAHRYALSTSDLERVTILSGGNVGIGTTSPSSKLDVLGSNNSSIITSTIGTTLANGLSSFFRGMYAGIERFNIQVNSNGVNNPDYAVIASGLPLVFSTGNIGIGTTSPAYKLDVLGGIRSDGASNGLFLRNVFTAEIVNPNSSTRDIQFNQNTNGTVFFRGDGMVGIGTTSPSQKLDVQGNINIENSAPYIHFNDTTVNTSDYRVGVSAIVEGDFFIEKYNGSTFDKALYINASRKIGIKTTSPIGDLHISAAPSSNSLILQQDSAAAGYQQILFSVAGSVDGNSGNGAIIRATSNRSLDGYSALGFYTSTDASVAPTLAMHINGLQRVGIGTLSPTEKLHVNGNILLSASCRIMRSTHETGNLEGGYNNIGASGSYTNPIYTIGSAYNPNATTLNNMYGIGYADGSVASYLSSFGGGWGMYVAADGDARIFLDGANGAVKCTSVLASGEVTAFSDLRIKKKIKPYRRGLDIVSSINTVAYKLKEGDDRTHIGVIAQELQKLEPLLVETQANGLLSVNYQKLSILLINSVNDLKKEIEQLKAA